MLTFFTTAKAFQGHSAIIQRNALHSWKLLHPDVEVILFGDDEGAAQVCTELGLRHEPHVERHESGMKYIDYMFARAQQIARHRFLCYSNCDIILLQDFWNAFEKALQWRDHFFLVGRRWDTNVTEPINFASADWRKELRHLAVTTGIHQHPHFADFFVFPNGLYDHVPKLVVGRSAWDAWLIWKGLSAGLPLLDASLFVVAVHQNHDYGYHPQGKKGTHEDYLADRNRELCGKGRHLRTMDDSTHELTQYGKIRRTPFRRFFKNQTVEKLSQSILIHSFWIRSRLGLRRQTLDRILHHTDDAGN